MKIIRITPLILAGLSFPSNFIHGIAHVLFGALCDYV